MTRQDKKDYLWTLDHYTETLTATIATSTGEAWKAFIEHDNYRKHLLQAQQLSLNLSNRLTMALKVLDTKKGR